MKAAVYNVKRQKAEIVEVPIPDIGDQSRPCHVIPTVKLLNRHDAKDAER